MTHRTAYVKKTNTLNQIFLKKNYNADFIRQNICRPTEADAANRNPTPVTSVTIPYIKGTSESISLLLQSLRHLLTNVKDRGEPSNRQGALCKIKCSDCQASYISETSRNLNANEPRETVMPTITLLCIIN